MPEKIGNYSEQETKELWDAWADQFALENPIEAEQFVEAMLEGENNGAE